MDIQRPSNAHAKKISRIGYAGIAMISVAGVTYGVSRLRPAAPSVDKATTWTDEVKRSSIWCAVHAIGTRVRIGTELSGHGHRLLTGAGRERPTNGARKVGMPANRLATTPSHSAHERRRTSTALKLSSVLSITCAARYP